MKVIPAPLWATVKHHLKRCGYPDNLDTDAIASAAVAAVLEVMKAPLEKRPVAWRVKDFADGWIIFHDEEAANKEVEQTGAIMQGLYVRDGT